MSLVDAVREALTGNPGMRWQRELALSMAADLDQKQNASMSNALRALMDDLGAADVERKGDVSDDLAAKRAARRQAAG